VIGFLKTCLSATPKPLKVGGTMLIPTPPAVQ
jgi:hypothetical protein